MPEVISFPGIDGVPFRGESIPLLKQHEVDNLVEVIDAKVRIFKLNVDKDLEAYTQILDRIAKGIYISIDEKINWVPEERTWYVFLRYGERYKEQSTHAHRKLADSVGGFRGV